MVLALVVDLAVVMDKGKVVIEECLDTSMDHFRMFLFFICSSFSYVLVAHVLPFVFIVFTDHYVSLIVGMAASQPNKPTMKEDGEDEMAGWWEKAAKKLREEDAAKLKKKKEEELEKKRKERERERATHAMWAREQALVRKCEEAQKKRQKDFKGASSYKQTNKSLHMGHLCLK